MKTVIITIDHVRDEHREADEIGELEDTKPSEKSKPVESVIGSAGEDGHTDGRANNGRKEHPKTHLRFANTTIFASSPGCETIRDWTDGDGE